MKKYLYSALAFSAMATLASCASDDPKPIGDGVTFTVQLPDGFHTRATFGDKDQVNLNNLQWVVYEQQVTGDNTTWKAVDKGAKENAFTNNATEEQVSIDLLKNRTYKVVFYADNSDNNFVTFTDGNVNVKYTEGVSNDKEEDCFVGTSGLVVSSGVINKTVELRRPFAQLNWGTNDLDYGVVKPYLGEIAAKVVVTSGLYTTYNVIDDKFSNPATGVVSFDDVKFSKLPTATFPVENYELIAMNYLLTNVAISCELQFNFNLGSVKVDNATMQPNYRTNIYGSLLTNPGQFNINILPGFEEPDINIAAWDGKATTMPVLDTETMTATISTPAQLAGLAAMVNGSTVDGKELTPDALEGYTLNLTSDLDMGGFEMPTIGSGSRNGSTFNGTAFSGVIDGKGHTIKNFKITNDNTNGNTVNAFIPGLSGANAALRNLNFQNAIVASTTGEQTAVAVGLLEKGATVENVKVLSGSVSGTEATAGIVSRILGNGTVTNCSNAATITGSSHNTGGVVGVAYRNVDNQTMQIRNCTNSGKVTGTTVVGGVIGYSIAIVFGCSNSGDIYGSYNVGGIVGNQLGGYSVKKCLNVGSVNTTFEITGDATSGGAGAMADEKGAGGIIGSISYWGAIGSGNKHQLIEVDNNINRGVVNSQLQAGGIVGLLGHGAIITNNTNYASSIKGYDVAGIVGIWRGYKQATDIAYQVTITDNKTVTLSTTGIARTDPFINWWSNKENDIAKNGLVVEDSGNTIIAQ